MNTSPARFLLDAMLGKLARWLRVLGWDAAYVKDISIEQLLHLATDQDRILLTRRQGVTHPHLIFIQSEELEAQLRQLESLHHILTDSTPFTRCIDCNTLLDPIPKSQVRGKVPFFTYQTQKKFFRCPQCGKVFWPGSHHQAMLAKVSRLKDPPSSAPPPALLPS